jgi:hypothetical protein
MTPLPLWACDSGPWLCSWCLRFLALEQAMPVTYRLSGSDGNVLQGAAAFVLQRIDGVIDLALKVPAS